MIKTFQSFRFIALLCIFLSHLGYLGLTKYGYLYKRFFQEGYLGTTFFFLLSGVVISYSYNDKIKSSSIKNSICFLFNRLKKIYPLHLIMFIVSIPLMYKYLILDIKTTIINGILNLLLLQSFIPNQKIYFSYNTISWFLSAITLCYLLTPFIIIVINNNIRKINFWYLICFTYIIQLVYVYIFKDNLKVHWLVYINPLFRILDYLNGIFLGYLIKEIRNHNNKLKNSTIVEIVALGMLVLAFYFYPHIKVSYRYGVYYEPFFIIIIYVFSFEQGLISKFISNKVLVYLGSISFELFMFHRLILLYFSQRIGVKYPVLTIIATIVTIFIFNYIYSGTKVIINNYKVKHTLQI